MKLINSEQEPLAQAESAQAYVEEFILLFCPLASFYRYQHMVAGCFKHKIWPNNAKN